MISPPQEERGAITHVGYHFMGASTRFPVYGITASFCVTDPGVRQGVSEFVAAWIMVDTFTPQRWTQVGWAKVGWRDSRKFIFVYETEHNQWLFYDQYPIAPGDCVTVSLSSEGTRWSTWLWWNDTWNLLNTAELGFSSPDRGDEYVEVYTPDGVHPALPASQMYGTNIQTTDWFLWDESFDTYEQNTGAPTYQLNWTSRWYDGTVNSQ